MRKRVLTAVAVVLGLVGSGLVGALIASGTSSAAAPGVPMGDLTGDGTVDSYSFGPAGDGGCLLTIKPADTSGAFARKTFPLSVNDGDAANNCPDGTDIEKARSDGIWELFWYSGTSDYIQGAVRTAAGFEVTDGSMTQFGSPSFQDTDGDGLVDYVTSGSWDNAQGQASIVGLDGRFIGSLQVPVYDVNISASLSARRANYGDPLTLDVSVDPSDGFGTGGSPTGVFDVFVDDKPAGTFSYVPDDNNSSAFPLHLESGPHRVWAVYEGDSNYVSGRTAEFSVLVVGAGTTTTFKPVTYSPVWGQANPLTVSVVSKSTATGAPKPSGSAQLIVDGVPQTQYAAVVNGVATIAPPTNLSVGAHTFQIHFLGGNDFQQGATPVTNITVRKTGTGIKITPSPTAPKVGQKVTFAIQVGTLAPGTGTPTGTVSVKIDSGAAVTLPLVNGTASTSATFTTNGNHTIAVSYPGDAQHGSSSKTLTLQVKL